MKKLILFITVTLSANIMQENNFDEYLYKGIISNNKSSINNKWFSSMVNLNKDFFKYEGVKTNVNVNQDMFFPVLKKISRYQFNQVGNKKGQDVYLPVFVDYNDYFYKKVDIESRDRWITCYKETNNYLVRYSETKESYVQRSQLPKKLEKKYASKVKYNKIHQFLKVEMGPLNQKEHMNKTRYRYYVIEEVGQFARKRKQIKNCLINPDKVVKNIKDRLNKLKDNDSFYKNLKLSFSVN